MKYTLRRFAESPDGTFGHLDNGDGRFSFTTLEEEGLDNARNESRIPAGTYTCKRTIYQRYGYETFEVMDVLDRTRILFHPGNTEEDTAGCILPGTDFAMLSVTDEDTGKRTRKMGVISSRIAFRNFMRSLARVDEFELEIIDPKWRIGPDA